MEDIVFLKEPEKIFLKKPLHLNCKRCTNPYILHVPYEEANDPARDLCDDCILDLDIDEFLAYKTEPGEVIEI